MPLKRYRQIARAMTNAARADSVYLAKRASSKTSWSSKSAADSSEESESTPFTKMAMKIHLLLSVDILTGYLCDPSTGVNVLLEFRKSDIEASSVS